MSPETPAGNRFTSHCNHHLDAPKEVEAVVEVEVGATEEADYPLQQGQAYSRHTGEPLTLTNFWAVNQKPSQETGRKSSPSSRNGNSIAESMPITQQYKTNTREQCCS
jgi:hypothetical protein